MDTIMNRTLIGNDDNDSTFMGFSSRSKKKKMRKNKVYEFISLPRYISHLLFYK